MTSALRNGSRALAHRNYRLFFGGQGVSLVGTWMQSIAQAWLVLQLTSDPFVLGLLSALQFLPVLILGLFGGIVADALPKRKTLIVTQTVQMLLAFALFVLAQTGAVQVWHILALATLLGISNAVDMPTRQAFAVEMVGREDIQNAVALNSALFNGARIIGPAVAGFAIGILGIAPAFLINGLSFLAVIVAYGVMRDDDLHSPPRAARPTTVGEVRRSLGDGLRYVKASPIVLMPIVLIGLASTFGMNFGVVIPAMADEVLRTDATGFGILMAATGIGSMVAALAIAFTGHAKPVAIGLGSVALGIGLVLAGLTTSFALALPIMALIGFGAIGMAATANTTVQLNIEDAYRGRVMSVYTTVFAGSTPIGGLFVGWLASSYSVATTLLVSGVLCVVTGAVGVVWYRQIQSATASGLAEEPTASGEHVGAAPAGARPR